ncbi:MAG TPA: SxtJ family membrane protein [Candidatus Omnitrophota bacterium]|nr:SxtJ family membrane protein [Candidatus Omnitrophota bacterium]
MDKERKNLLVFGYGWAIILTVIALRLWIKHGLSTSKIVLLSVAVLFALVSAWRVQLLKPVYKIWMAVGHKISFVISTIILSVLFYTVFFITAIVLRLLRKDFLNQTIQPELNSYWLSRKSSAADPQGFKRQF